jgi:hypothetical protein
VQAEAPSVAAPLATLLAQADSLMALPVVSVMDKPLLPPSGDKHDYMTRAPYFWPNPDTEDGLPYVKRDGELYEENRSGTDFYTRLQMEETVMTLALAYYLTDDARYAAHAARQLRAWFIDPATRMRPHLRYAQGVPGIMDGSEWGTIDNWRWPVLMDAIRLVGRSEAWTDADQAALQDWFGDYSTWLETGEPGYHAGLMWNNHGSFYDAQRASAALFAGEEARAREIVIEAWHRRIDHGIEGDGRQRYEMERTRPFGYSLFNLRSYFNLAAIAEHLGMDLWNHRAADGSGIRPALDYLVPYADPAVEWPYPDLKFERHALLPMLRWGAIAYDDSSYVEAARQLPDYEATLRSVPRFNVDLYQIFLTP